MSQDNLRAALIAAASLAAADDVFSSREWRSSTPDQRLQHVLDRAEELAEWLDRRERGILVTARDVMRTAAPAEPVGEGRAARRQQTGAMPRISPEDMDRMRAYARWLDERGINPSPEAEARFLAES